MFNKTKERRNKRRLKKRPMLPIGTPQMKQKESRMTQEILKFRGSGTMAMCHEPVWDQVIVNLRYQDTTLVRNNVGGTIISWRYRCNSAFDPDPALGTGALSGFIEWAAFYNAYRVVGIKYRAIIANKDLFPLVIVAAPTPLDVGLNYANTIEMGEFPHGQSQQISMAGGMDKATMEGNYLNSELQGSSSYWGDDAFASNTTTNPSQLMYLNFGAVSSAAFVNGIFANIVVEYKIHFYRRTNIPS